MPLPHDTAWFRRRKYGIGWALHKSWQGWLLTVTYLLLAAAGLRLFGESRKAFSIYLVILAVGAAWLCWWKGERSLWRGGRVEHHEK